MSTTSNPYRGYRFPAGIINQAVWLYHCFSLSLREVELILAARGIVVSYDGTVALTLAVSRGAVRQGAAPLSLLKRRRFPVEIILLCVRWYCKYGISYRDLAEMMHERGINVNPSTIFRWVQRYAPEIEKRVRP